MATADAYKVEVELKKIVAALNQLATKVASVESRLSTIERAQKTADLQNRL